MSRGASNAYKALMQETLKPATQIRFREAAVEGYIPLTSNDGIDMNIVKNWVLPTEPNYKRYATLDNFGWKVDDASYICPTASAPITNTTFITVELTANTDTAIQDNIGISAERAGTLYLKIAPIHCSSLTVKFGKTDHHGGFTETPQEVTIDGTTMTDFVTISFTAVQDSYLLVFNVSEACRISYYPLSTNAEDPVAIFDNSNILSVDVEEFLDLYSQQLPRFTVTVKIYDVTGEYDPINPQGNFAKFVQDFSVRMMLGYVVNGFLETPFTVLLYLNDTPRYENKEITLSFSTVKSADNKYENTLPTISGNPGAFVANKTYSAGVYSISSNGFDTLITREEMNQIIYSIYGQGIVFKPEPLITNRSLYTVVRIKHFTDYEILNKNSIKIDRKPVLKALTIKQYTNTIPTTYQDTMSGVFTNGAYRQWSTTDVRPYRAIIDVSDDHPENDFSDVCRVDEIRLTGATNMAWSFVNYVDPDTGAARLQLYIYCSSYNISGNSTYNLGLSHVKQSVNDITESVNTDGENMIIDNHFITDRTLVQSCATWVKQIAYYRDYYTFDAVADYLTDVGDWIVIDTPYESSVPLYVTDIKYKMPGGTCTITGARRFSIPASDYSSIDSRFAHLNSVEYIGSVSATLVGYFHTTGGRTDVVTVSVVKNFARIRAAAIGYDTQTDGNVINITDSTSLTWYTDIADHSIAGSYDTDECEYLGEFADVEAAARYLIVQAYLEQGYTVTLGV